MQNIALISAVALTSAAVAVPVPVSSKVADSVAGPGDGLAASVYTGVTSTSFAGWDSEFATPADGEFMSTLVNYPEGPADTLPVGSPIGTFLGADAPSLTGLPGSTPVSSTLFRFEGFIFIPDAGTPTFDITFAVASDDGFRLTIGGAEIIGDPSDRAFALTSGVATFEMGGLYPIALDYRANATIVSGVEFFSTIPGGPADPTVAGTPLSLVPTGALYKVPAPGASVLALAGLGIASRRRR